MSFAVGTARDWMAPLRDLDVLDVVRRLEGFEPRPGHSFAPCPSCGADRRSNSDPTEKRGPAGLTRSGEGWRCHRCDAGGDAIELVRLVEREHSREWFVSAGFLIDSEPPREGHAAPRPGRVPIPAPKREPSPPQRPPVEEVAALWESALPVTEDAEALEWMRAPKPNGRGWPAIVAERIAEQSLARVIDAGARGPLWARSGGREWSVSGHRLIVPLWGASGRLESVRARWCRPVQMPEGVKKDLAPLGFEVRGLVMADSIGRALLETGRAIEALPHLRELVALWIAEGTPDFLHLVASDAFADVIEKAQGIAPAVWGIFSGSLTAEMFERVPSCARVVVASDPDNAGGKYAALVREGLAARCRVGRLKL